MALFDPHNELPRLEYETRSQLQALARQFTAQTGLSLSVRKLGGRRTCAQQNALYAEGRTTGGEIVTQASGCTSWHVLGRAADIDPVTTDSRLGRPEADYARAGAIWAALGGKWGGTFPGFPDIGHFEWHPGLTIEQACPSPSYCAAIEASIQTTSPLAGYLLAGGLAAFGALRLARWLRG